MALTSVVFLPNHGVTMHLCVEDRGGRVGWAYRHVPISRNVLVVGLGIHAVSVSVEVSSDTRLALHIFFLEYPPLF